MPRLSRREVLVGGAVLAAECKLERGVAVSAPEENGDVELFNGDNAPLGRPIHLSATATVRANTTTGVPSLLLKNPSGEPMELHEVKWRISSPTYASGGSIGCKLDLGNVAITNGFVPVWNFGPGYNHRAERVRALVDASLNEYVIGEYVWRLQHPLYIPPSAVLQPSISHRGSIPEPITVRISYSGRTLSAIRKGPFKIPYVSCYSAKVFSRDVDTLQQDESSETDLLNVFAEPLRVHRFIGRLVTIRTSNSIARVYGFADYPNADEANKDAYTGRVRIMSSLGDALIPRMTSFGHVFNPQRHSWETDGVLPPEAFFKVYYENGINSTNEYGANKGFSAAFVSMIGTREVKA